MGESPSPDGVAVAPGPPPVSLSPAREREREREDGPRRDGPRRDGTGGARVPEIRGRVRIASGPWLVEEGWWIEGGGGESARERTARGCAAREYWDVVLEDAVLERGGLYRVFRDRGNGRWYADGVYD